MSKERDTCNPFRLGVRGNIKSNAQIDSFLKSQEVFKLVQNALGSPGITRESTSFRIPLKPSTSRANCNGRSKFKNADERNSRNRNSFKGQRAMRGNSRKNNRRTKQKPSHGGMFSRRGRDNHSSNKPRPSSFSNHSCERSRDVSSSKRGFENSRPKYSASIEIMSKGNTAWRDYEKPESQHQFSSDRIQPDVGLRNCFQYKGDTDCPDAPGGNNSYSNIHSQQVEKPFPPERDLDNAFDQRIRERYSSSEVLGCDKDVTHSPNDHSRQHNGGSNRYSNIQSPQVEKSSSPQRRLDNPFLDVYDPTSRERHSSSERFACDRDLKYGHNRKEHCESKESYESSRGQTDCVAETNSAHSQRQESDNESRHDKVHMDKVAAKRERKRKRKRNQRKLRRALKKKADKSLLGKPGQFEIKDHCDPMGKVDD